MKLEVRARGVKMTESLRDHIETRLRFALGRFHHRVRRVRVRVTDVNGPRGGEDIQCQLEATLVPTGSLIVEELRGNPFSAVARASERMSYRMARHLERWRLRRRGR